MIQQIFVNLPVRDLEKTKAFWTALGFSFNPQFTDEKSACLVLGENMFAMLLMPEFFKSFIPGYGIAEDPNKEAIFAFALGSRAEVDEIVRKAIEQGGKEPSPVDEHGWMYGRSFTDPDGHLWGPFYADMAMLGGRKPS